MASKSFDSIISDIIDNILIVDPTIDVKVGAVVRDIFIDVQASQIETLYSIANNTAQAQSVTTALNTQLDRLAFNYGILRDSARRAGTNVVVSIKAGVQAPTPLNIGDQFYTKADQNNDIKVFINTQFQLLQPGQTQTTIPVTALNPGADGNVAAYTITENSYDFADAVYNPEPSSGGQDRESDAAFALRIPYQLTGQYINTSRGIINTVLNISDINGAPYFVTPDNPQSRGPYTVDVYLKRSAAYFGTVVSEIAPANQQDYVFLKQPLYSLEPINQVSTYNPITGLTSIVDPAQYTITNDPADVLQSYVGSTKANQRLHWVNQPPANPYTISYNYDHTIVDAQDAYDIHDEITADTLFKQAKALPIYISANISVNSGSNLSTIYQNALQNFINLFNNLSITQSLTDKAVEFALLSDRNVQNVDLTNLDTTFQLVLRASEGTYSAFAGPNVQSQITPLGFYYEVDPSTSVMSYPIAARLWIGKPDIITPGNQNPTTGFNFKSSSYLGIVNQSNIRNIIPSWQTDVYTFFDQKNSTLILNFTAEPPVGGTLTLTFVQSNIDTSSGLGYLTLAPSIVSPVEPYASNVQTSNPQYATRLPNGIADIAQARLYKNGVELFQTSTQVVADYTIISGPDPITGIINIQFTVTPASTDIFQFGILNPNLNISYSSSQFSR